MKSIILVFCLILSSSQAFAQTPSNNKELNIKAVTLESELNILNRKIKSITEKQNRCSQMTTVLENLIQDDKALKNDFEFAQKEETLWALNFSKLQRCLNRDGNNKVIVDCVKSHLSSFSL